MNMYLKNYFATKNTLALMYLFKMLSLSKTTITATATPLNEVMNTYCYF